MPNGYTNYETFSVCSELDNSACFDYLCERCKNQLEKAGNKERAINRLMDLLKEDFFENIPPLTDNDIRDVYKRIYDSLLRIALHNVNWAEVADHFLPYEPIE